MIRNGLSGNLAGKSLPRQVVSIAIWPLLEQILSFICASVALVLVGRMDIDAGYRAQLISGIGVAGYVTWLGFLIQAGVATGATALVSRLFGARRYVEANAAALQAGFMGLFSGVLAALVMYFSADFLLTDVIGLGVEAADAGTRYLHIVAWMAVGSGAVFAINAALRGSGDTRTPFFAMLLVDGLTIILSYIFVWHFNWGVEGLAWGALISWLITVIFLIVLMFYRERGMRARLQGQDLDAYCATQPQSYAPNLFFSLRTLGLRLDLVRRIMAVGLPQSIEVFVIWVIQFYSLSLISSLGDVAVGAHTVAIRIESMSFLPGFAIGIAGAALVGQYLGAGSVRLALETVKRCIQFAMLLMGGMGLLFALFPHFFVGIFVPDSPAIAGQAMGVLLLFLVAEPAFAVMMVCRMCLRGAGDTKRVMLISFTSMGLLRFLALTIWARCFPGSFSLFGIWLVFTIDLYVQASLLLWRLYGLRWARLNV